MANAGQNLQQAYELIEDGDLSAARQLLEDIRSDSENDPDFWWVYAHAVEDAAAGREALTRVRQLAPNYPGLTELSQEAGLPSPQPIQSLTPPPPPAMRMQGDDELDDPMVDDFDETGAATDASPRNMLISIGGFVLLVVILLGILWVSGIFGGDSPAEPTEVADQPTSQATVVQQATADTSATDDDALTAEAQSETEAPTDEPMATTAETGDATTAPTDEPMATTAGTDDATTEPTAIVAINMGDPFANLYDDLTPFGVPIDGIREEETTLGNSLVFQTCTSPGPAANESILGVLDTFKTQSIMLEDDVDALAFEITNCETDSIALILGIDVETINAYLMDESDIASILRGLRRIG